MVLKVQAIEVARYLNLVSLPSSFSDPSKSSPQRNLPQFLLLSLQHLRCKIDSVAPKSKMATDVAIDTSMVRVAPVLYVVSRA